MKRRIEMLIGIQNRGTQRTPFAGSVSTFEPVRKTGKVKWTACNDPLISAHPMQLFAQ